MKSYKKISLMAMLVNSLTFGIFSFSALASERNLCYEVTVTNLTAGQVFTPVVAVVHKKDINLFTLGQPVSEELAELAESGATGPLVSLLESNPRKFGGVAVSDGPFFPGESVVVQLPASKNYSRLSLASMLAITNDGFVSLNNVAARTYLSYSPVYDAGSEPNTEMMNTIPGTGGVGYNADEDGEGFVHIHGGIHGIGDLDNYSQLDWKNPAAKITSRLIGCSSDRYQYED